jgi:hypothetical protein
MGASSYKSFCSFEYVSINSTVLEVIDNSHQHYTHHPLGLGSKMPRFKAVLSLACPEFIEEKCRTIFERTYAQRVIRRKEEAVRRYLASSSSSFEFAYDRILPLLTR